MDEEVKLFRTWSSPYALRIVWALDLKGVSYETVYEDLSSKSALLLEYNPVHKKVPVLVHNGRPVAESLVILEYVDETWTRNPLFPEDPWERAKVRLWAKFNDEKVMPSIWAAFKKEGKDQEEALPAAIENLQILEELLEGKKFFGGEEISALDIVLGWLANLVSVFEEVCGLQIMNEVNFPHLAGWMSRFSNSPVITKSWPPRDRLIIKFRDMRHQLLASS